MLDGINVLNTIELTKMTSNPIVHTIGAIMIIITIIGIICSLVCTSIDSTTDKNVDLFYLFSGFVFLIGLFGSIIFVFVLDGIFSKEVPTGEYEYQVTIDESVSMVDFTSKYDIIRVDGEIYTIREKE